MELPESHLNKYSNNSNSSLNITNYSNSNNSTVTVSAKIVLANVSDLIKDPKYNPWYVKQLRLLGNARFMELANKARAGSETPERLFKWMIENNGIVE